MIECLTTIFVFLFKFPTDSLGHPKEVVFFEVMDVRLPYILGFFFEFFHSNTKIQKVHF